MEPFVGTDLDLGTSHGSEGLGIKLAMRISSLVVDALVYLPAVYLFVVKFYRRDDQRVFRKFALPAD